MSTGTWLQISPYRVHSIGAILVILDLIDALPTLGKQVVDISLHFLAGLRTASILSECLEFVLD